MKTIRNSIFMIGVMALLAVSAVADEGDYNFIRIGGDPFHSEPGDDIKAVFVGDIRLNLHDRVYIQGYGTSQKNSEAFISFDILPEPTADLELRAGAEDEYLKGGVYLSGEFGDPGRPGLGLTLGGECLEREVALIVEKNDDPNDTEKEQYDCGGYFAIDLMTYANFGGAPSMIYLRGDIGVGSWSTSTGVNIQMSDSIHLTVAYIYEEPDRAATDKRKEGEAFDAPRIKSDTLNLKGEKRFGLGVAWLF